MENTEKLQRLKNDALANLPKFIVKRNGLINGKSSSIQTYLIDEARKYAKSKGLVVKNADRAWGFYEYLSQYDMQIEDSKKTLERMIVTNGGNAHTASEFLNYTSMAIASDASKLWSELDNNRPKTKDNVSES